MMLNANNPEFSARYPYGATVRDRWGRLIPRVIACDPETGEVISYDGTWLTGEWLRLTRRLRIGVVTRHVFRWASPSGGLLRRHGFWPALLTVEGRLLRTPDPDPEQAAEINRIAAAMAERNAAVRQELARLGGSARDATWAVRRLLGEP